MKSRFWFLFWFVCVLVGFLFGCSIAHANTYTQSHNGANISVTYSISGSGFTYSYSVSGSAAEGGTNIALYLVPCDSSGAYLGSGVATIGASFGTSGTASGASSGSFTGGNGYYWAGSWASADNPSGVSFSPGTPFFAESKKVKVSYLNSQDYPVTVRLVGVPSGVTIVTSVVPAHSGFIEEVVLSGDDTSAALFVDVGDVSWDGQRWVEETGAVSSIKVATVAGTTGGTTPTTTVNQPANMPAAVPGNPLDQSSSTSSPRPSPPKMLWKPDTEVATEAKPDVDRLDKKTFREGISGVHDQVALAVDELKKGNERMDKAKTDAAAEPALESYTPAVQGTTAVTLPASKIPAPPTFFTGTIGSASTISATFPSFTILGKTWPSYAFSYDFSHHATPIAFFRGLLVVLISISFFIKCIQTIKGSSATEK